jgi:pimeloyl-ACP methyl ester carboxylesterase
VLDAMHLDHVVLVGHSFSGRATMQATFLAPERIEKLVLVDAALDIDPPKSTPVPTGVVPALLHVPVARNLGVSLTLTNPRLTHALLLKLISNPQAATPERVRMLQRPFVQQGTTVAYGAWVEPFMTTRDRSLATQSARYRTLTIPTLILWGGRDAVTPVHQGRALARLIPGSSLVVLPGAGHIPAIESPKAFDDALMTFIVPGTVAPSARLSLAQPAGSP